MKKYTIASGQFNIGNLSQTYIEYGKNEPSHMHEGIEIMFVVAGHGMNIINGKHIPAKRGTFIMMSNQCVHEIKMWDTLQYYNIMFNPALFDESIGLDTSFYRFVGDVFGYDIQEQFLSCEISNEDVIKYIEALFLDMLSEIVSKKQRYLEMVHNYTDIIITHLLRTYITANTTNKDNKMESAMEYICEHCMEELKLEDVSQMFHYNPDYFSKKLKTYYGTSFKQILIHQKLSNVVHELLNTDDSVDKIIARNGFMNKTHFYDVFTKAYGVKPRFIREYRNNYRSFIEIKTQYKGAFLQK